MRRSSLRSIIFTFFFPLHPDTSVMLRVCRLRVQPEGGAHEEGAARAEPRVQEPAHQVPRSRRPPPAPPGLSGAPAPRPPEPHVAKGESSSSDLFGFDFQHFSPIDSVSCDCDADHVCKEFCNLRILSKDKGIRFSPMTENGWYEGRPPCFHKTDIRIKWYVGHHIPTSFLLSGRTVGATQFDRRLILRGCSATR